METVKIYVWPDYSWEYDDEIKDLDWYIFTNGKSDDFYEVNIPITYSVEEIEELIKKEQPAKKDNQ